jgi:hypothetical protein
MKLVQKWFLDFGLFFSLVVHKELAPIEIDEWAHRYDLTWALVYETVDQ